MTNYQDVNKALNQVVDYLKSTETVWNQARTLKLHRVFFHCDDIISKYPLVEEEYKSDDLFYQFCEDSYDQFTEWMQENGIDDCRKYIGRTSSFYLTDLHDDNIGAVITELMSRIYDDSIDFDNNGMMIPFTATDYYTEAELINEYQADMEYIASGEFLTDIKKYLHDAEEIAEYIDDFMEHQTDYFKEYIECENDGLEYQAQKEAEEEQAFTDKFSDSIDRLTADIEAVIRDTGCTLSEARRIVNKSFESITLDGITQAEATA